MTDIELRSGGNVSATNPSSWRGINQQAGRVLRTRASSHVNVCDQCYRRKLGCSRAKPSCDRCHQAGRQCTYSLCRPAGRPRRPKSDQRRESRSFSIPNREDTHQEQGAKDGYFNSNQASASASCHTGDDAELASGEQSMLQMLDPTASNLTSPTTLVGSNSSESMIFVDPAVWSKPARPDYRSAAEKKAPAPLTLNRETSLDRNQNRGHASTSSSAEDHYRDGPRLRSQSDAAFDASVSSRHTGTSTHPMTSQLESEIMDFDFGGDENYVMENGEFDTASVAASSDDGCFCLSDILQSFETRTNSCQTKTGSWEVVRMLNETSERLIHCRENHSGIWYSMLLALYEDAEGSLRPVPPCEQKLADETHPLACRPGVVGSSDKSNSAREQCSINLEASSFFTSIIFKAFTALSTIVAALPFKHGANIDKVHQDGMVMYAEKLRNKFRSRLMEALAANP